MEPETIRRPIRAKCRIYLYFLDAPSPRRDRKTLAIESIRFDRTSGPRQSLGSTNFRASCPARLHLDSTVVSRVNLECTEHDNDMHHDALIAALAKVGFVFLLLLVLVIVLVRALMTWEPDPLNEYQNSNFVVLHSPTTGCRPRFHRPGWRLRRTSPKRLLSNLLVIVSQLWTCTWEHH